MGLAKTKELAKFRADQTRLQAEHTIIQAKIQSKQTEQMKILAMIQTDHAKGQQLQDELEIRRLECEMAITNL